MPTRLLAVLDDAMKFTWQLVLLAFWCAWLLAGRTRSDLVIYPHRQP
jgi:hypothetical protein